MLKKKNQNAIIHVIGCGKGKQPYLRKWNHSVQ